MERNSESQGRPTRDHWSYEIKIEWLLVDHIARRGVRRANERCLSCVEELEQNQNKGNVRNCGSDEAEEGR